MDAISHIPPSAIGEVRYSLPGGSSINGVMYVKQFLEQSFNDGSSKWSKDAVSFVNIEDRTVTISMSNCIVMRY